MLRNKLRPIRAFIPSLFFNFHSLPFRQAVKMPIIVYKLKLYNVGKIIINSDKVTFGMIRLGYFITPQYPDKGIIWDNKGTVLFKGKACISSNSAVLTVRKSAQIWFGNNFVATTTLHLNCDHKIIFGEDVLIGWNVTIFDSQMHRLKDSEDNFTDRGYYETMIGSYNWIAMECIVMPGTKTPDYCVCAAGSLMNRDYSAMPERIMLAGRPAVMKKHGVWLDRSDCTIEY